MSETTAVVMGNQGNEQTGAQGVNTSIPAQINANVDTKDIELMLQTLVKTNKKQVRWARTAGIFMILLFVVIGGALFILIPQITHTLSNINAAVQQANDILVQAEDSLKDINDMSASLTTTSDQLSTMISQNSEALASSISQIESIDFEGLNAAIADLETTVGPLANFMSRFNR